MSQMVTMKLVQTAIARRNITEKQQQAESKYAKEKIMPTPETVTVSSSSHPIFGELGADNPTTKEVDMMAGVKHDVVSTILPWCLF